MVGDGDESPVLPLTLQNRAAPRVHKKGECLKCHNEPSYFVLDFVDVPAGNGIMSCITATRDRPGISTIVKFVDRVMRPSL